MKTTIRKTACAVLAGAVFFAMTGCAQTKETEKTGKTEKETEETTEETAEETTQESQAIDPDEILETVEVYCDAVAQPDAETMVELSAEGLEDADTYIEYLNFDECTQYSSDMGLLLSAIAGTITYEVDEDSLEVDEDAQTAEVTVTFTEFDFYGDADEDFPTYEDFLSYVESGDTMDSEIVITLELTDNGWRITNTEEVADTVYEFVIMASLAPDFEFDADTTSGDEPLVTAEGDEPVLTYFDRNGFDEVGTYPEVEYAPNYYACLTYSDYEVYFTGSCTFNINGYDFNTHIGTVDAGETFEIEIEYYGVEEPELTGFTFTIDHDGDITVEETDDFELSVDVDPSATGNYTITLADPWGRTIWEGYFEIV